MRFYCTAAANEARPLKSTQHLWGRRFRLPFVPREPRPEEAVQPWVFHADSLWSALPCVGPELPQKTQSRREAESARPILNS
jgi:hypothetical protein